MWALVRDLEILCKFYTERHARNALLIAQASDPARRWDLVKLPR